VAEVNTLLKQFKEMQKMMKGMASGNMPNIPGMGPMAGMSSKAARKLAAQTAAGRGAGGPGGADFDMLSQLMGDSGDLGAENPLFPGLPASSAPRPIISGNKGTKKKKKGGRVTPPKSR
jgi:signal recognition particle subunit SRP54